MAKKPKAFVGVDLGGTSMLAAVVDRSGQIVGEAKRKTRAERGAHRVIERMVVAIEKAISRSGVKYKRIGGVGVGVPGPVDPASGTVVRCPNLGPTWNHMRLAQRLSKHLELPVTIDNDVNVGAVGEHRFGAGRGCDNLVAMFVGTGLGGGIILDGKLYTGWRYAAGEVGHMVISPDGPLCGCGQRGHAEALASRSAIERDIRAALEAGRSSTVVDILTRTQRTDMTSGVIGEAYDARDPVVVAAVERAQYYLGLLIANCVNILDPQRIIVGGGVLERMGDAYLIPVRHTAVQHYVSRDRADEIGIVPASLGDYSGALGAAALAQQRLS